MSKQYLKIMLIRFNKTREVSNLIANPSYAKQLKEMVKLLRSELVRVEDPSVEKFDHYTKVYVNKGQ